MANTLKIAQFFADSLDYLDSSKRREVFAEQIGRFIEFDDTEKFILDNKILGVEGWSKQEKNLFVHFMSNCPHKDLIISEYNKLVEDGQTLKSKNSSIKILNTLSEMLEAPAYKQGNFPRDVLSRAIEWSFDGDTDNLKLLKKSLSLYADTKTLNDFIGNDSERKKSAFAILKGMDLADQTREMNGGTLTGLAAVASLGLPHVMTGVNLAATKMVAGVAGAVGMVASTGELGQKLVQTVSENPQFATYTIGAASLYFTYKAFQSFHKLAKQVITKDDEKRIAGIDKSKAQELNSNEVISQKLLMDIIHFKNFDMNDQSNRNYLHLSALLVEKINNPNFKIPQEIAKEMKLSKAQVERFNSLTVEDVHEIANIKNPLARRTVALESLPKEEVEILKTISLMHEIGAIKPPKDGRFFKPMSEIENLPKELLKKITEQPQPHQKIIQSYLALYCDNDNKCLPSVIRIIERGLNTEKSISTVLKAELDTEFFNMKPSIPKREELQYFNRFWNWLKNDRTLSDIANNDVKKELVAFHEKYDFSAVEDINASNPSFKEIGSNLSFVTKALVEKNIEKFKSKFTSSEKEANKLNPN